MPGICQYKSLMRFYVGLLIREYLMYPWLYPYQITIVNVKLLIEKGDISKMPPFSKDSNNIDYHAES